jgi:RNA polymerase sigma-70 factor, ECF subfamily
METSVAHGALDSARDYVQAEPLTWSGDSVSGCDSRPADDGLSAFLSVRPRLFAIVYRMLGTAAQAEDVVQDVWIRWQMADRRLVRDAVAFLVTTATRLAINVMQSARSRRETDVGSSLPQPIDSTADPGSRAEQRQALAYGLLLLLDTLTAAERAAYILREAFDYPYRDIANVLRLEEPNARQLVTRARQHVARGRRMPASSTQQAPLLDAFIAAAENGDLAGLESLFAPHASSTSHGRGLVRASRRERRPSPLDESAALSRRPAA